MFTKHQLEDIEAREQAYALCKNWEHAYLRVDDMEQAGADPEAIRLALAKSKEARDAYDASGVELEISTELGAVLCAVSGAPIRATDETLHDWVTDEYVLRIAIGLPPRSSEQEALEAAE